MVSAWTIGTAKRQDLSQKTGNPGPGAYNYDKKQRQVPPNWKIGTSEREAFQANKTPGPGTYQLRPSTGKQGAQYSMATKAGPKNEQLKVPGPGAYNPRPSSAYHKPPAYSMGSKYDNEYKYNNKYIGPGSYEKNSTLQKTAPKFGTGSRQGLYGTNTTPGPGTYNYNDRPQTGNKTIGNSKRDELYKGSNTVGPGSYEVKSTFDFNKGVTMTGKRKYGDQTEASKVPGPGSYNPNKQQRKTAPQYKIGTGNRSNLGHFNKHTPGPGNYDHMDTMGQTKIKFGTDKRKPLNGNQDGPGPGNYELNTRIGEGAKYSIKGSTKVDPVTREKMMTPGPGQYSALTGVGKPRPTSAKIGTSTRPDFLKAKNTVGPGQYDHKPKTTGGPSFSFGNSKRPDLKKSDNPGPGNYTLPSGVGNVPAYSKNGINNR